MSIMSCENNIKLQINANIKQAVEAEIIKALKTEDYTLNTVNSYGENLLHISAANGCLGVITEILQKWDSHDVIDRKNQFGWTPLMLAIRNRDIKTVKFLLKQNVNINESTYLGMSVLGLAAAINKEMFEIVYEACPSALPNCINDDITPLCIAAMKNDKDLFFRLLELGFDVSKSNEYTQIMMKQSIVPEIRNLAKRNLSIENYWNDVSDNIPIEYNIENKCDIKKNNINNNNVLSPNIHTKPICVPNSLKDDNNECNNNIVIDSNKYLKPCALKLISKQLECVPHSLISPTITCTLDEILPQSPNIYFMQNKQDEQINFNIMTDIENKKPIENKDIITASSGTNDLSEPHLSRLQSICPPNLIIQTEQEDLDATLGYIPEFSPLRSPNVPPDINDENVFGESTPTPPRYKTPPRRMILNSEEAKMFVLLKQYGLSQHIPIFLEQEVDVSLFLTLTDADLIEIGIENESDRKIILNVIADCRKSMI
nr:ankyrin repeat domain-containing protein 12-like [Osmia lignaria]